MNFNKNKLINDTLIVFYTTFQKTLDTAEFVPEKMNNKIYKYIFKNMKKAFRQIDKEDRIFQRELKKKTLSKLRLKKCEIKKLKKQEKLKKRQEINQKWHFIFKRKKKPGDVSNISGSK